VWYQSSGERSKLVIRRLRCANCEKIHHELPDLLVPYKRYDAESIEGVLEEPSRDDIAADESTICRWRNWFAVWKIYAQGIIQSLSILHKRTVKHPSAPSQSALHNLGRYVGTAAGWLSRTVRPIANLNEWVTDPFCLLVQ
jgi:hypothetical protein